MVDIVALDAGAADSPKPAKAKRKVKPKKKRPSAPKAKRTAKKTAKPKKAKSKKPAKAIVRTERLDMRLSKAEKAKLLGKAKKTGRTITGLVIEAVAKIK